MAEFLPAFLISYSDSSFTNPHEVVLADEPPDCTGDFTHMGAKYWGFETARHQALERTVSGFRYDDDACHEFVIGLKHRCVVEEIRVSTKWFTGNQVPEVTLELIDGDKAEVVVERARLLPSDEHIFKIDAVTAMRCRVLCFHEGGIARVNLFGTAGEALYTRPNLLDMATISHVSNEHYGSPAMAVAGNRRENHMVGWESARSGFGERCVFSFAEPIEPKMLVVDTYLHRLNPPLSCHLFGCEGDLTEAMTHCPKWVVKFEDGSEVTPDNIQSYVSSRQFLQESVPNPGKFEVSLSNSESSPWQPLVAFGELKADTWHEFTLDEARQYNHLLYIHFPNGGVHGLKLY